MRIVWFFVSVGLLAIAVQAQDRAAPCENAMLVFDASISMTGRGIAEAREATRRVLPVLTRQRKVGLITYGGMPGPACDTIALRLEPAANSASLIQQAIDGLKPAGATPLTESVELAIALLARNARRGLVVLVTDGFENCHGDPCALARRLAAMGGEFKVHVIAYNLRVPQGNAVACLARETGGMLVEVNSTDELSRALTGTLGCPAVSWVSATGTEFYLGDSYRSALTYSK